LRNRREAGSRPNRPGRSRKSTQPAANGGVEFSPFEFLDRLADLVPPPRKYRHRYHGVFAPNHMLRPTVTALAIGNVGNRREAAAGGHGGDGHATEGCYDATPSHKPRSRDTSRIAWAKLLARVGEEFPLECPNCGGDIRLIAFITEPRPIRKILSHLGEPLEPPPISPARGPPTDWGELMQVHDDRAIFQATDRRAARDRHQQTLSGTGRKPPMPRGTANWDAGHWDAVCAEARKTLPQEDARRFGDPPPDGRHAQSRRSRTVRQPEDRRGSAIGRAILLSVTTSS